MRKHKRKMLEQKVEQLEDDFHHNRSHNLFKTVREMEGKPQKPLNIVKDKKGETHTNTAEVLNCWEDHFSQHLNTEFPHDPTAINEIPGVRPQDTEAHPLITREEIDKALKSMKYRKAPGIDAITAEVLRVAGEPMIQMLEKLFNAIWQKEQTPRDWSRMLVTPIHKKGDRKDPANYRAISLLSIPGKVFSKIILNRMKLKTEEAMKNRQFGFRQGRGTVDAIFIVRQIIEKAREQQVPLHFNFIDFKSAFDTVWRKALWRMMIAIGVDKKIVNIIEALYKDTECAIVIDGHITEWFKVNIGVRQGCILSPTLFNIFLEFVMKELKSLDQDLQMKNTLSVDIRYADDTTLISTVFNKLKISSGELEEACRKWGMKINGGKCKIISTSTDSIKIDGKNVDHVEEFVFLGSVVPDTSADVMRRIALAASAFGRLRKVIWDRHDISNHLKIRLYNALILPIATYASETWTLKSEDTRKLTVFEMRCLRSILGTTIADRIRNTYIITRSGIRHTIIDHIKTCRLSWFGHVVRRPEDSYVYKAYKDDFTQARPRGRPPKRWSAQIREDTGLPLLTLERRALNRGRWRGDVRFVNARGLRKA